MITTDQQIKSISGKNKHLVGQLVSKTAINYIPKIAIQPKKYEIPIAAHRNDSFFFSCECEKQENNKL